MGISYQTQEIELGPKLFYQTLREVNSVVPQDIKEKIDVWRKISKYALWIIYFLYTNHKSGNSYNQSTQSATITEILSHLGIKEDETEEIVEINNCLGLLWAEKALEISETVGSANGNIYFSPWYLHKNTPGAVKFFPSTAVFPARTIAETESKGIEFRLKSWKAVYNHAEQLLRRLYWLSMPEKNDFAERLSLTTETIADDFFKGNTDKAWRTLILLWEKNALDFSFSKETWRLSDAVKYLVKK